MQRNDDFSLSPVELISLLRTRVRWWVVPTIACTVLAAGYALLAPRQWRAVQAFTVRSEASSVSEQRLGKFSDLSEMKVRQATILELAKSQGVVQETLRAVGPPSRFRTAANWPTPKDVDEFRKHVDMRPPGGAEFGQTEVFYLSLLDTNQQRAADLVAELSDQLERRMQRLRDDRAQSMMAELERTVAMAESDLQARIEQLSKFETAIGADLAELRNLNAVTGVQSEVAQQSQAIEGERRANAATQRENEQLLAVLRAARLDPRQLVATPNTLLRSQPAISRLKNALVDAQVRTANLLGTLADEHPLVIAARESEKMVQSQLHDELDVAIQGIELDLEFNAGREASLQVKFDEGRERSSRLAAARAEYANLVAAVDNHTKLVEAARANLADARADHASAHSASVIARIDGVDAGVRPVGPRRATITAAGSVAGLILGFGVVFLFAGPRPAEFGTVAVDAAKPQAASAPIPSAAQSRAEYATAAQPFGMFRGMTLQEAIRSVERRLNGHNLR